MSANCGAISTFRKDNQSSEAESATRAPHRRRHCCTLRRRMHGEVVVDAEGGDHGIDVVLDGVYRPSMEDTDVRMILVGDADAITEALRRVVTILIQVRHSGVRFRWPRPANCTEAQPDCSILSP